MRNLRYNVYFSTSKIDYREISGAERDIKKHSRLKCDINDRAKRNLKSAPGCQSVDMWACLGISQFNMCLGSTLVAFHKSVWGWGVGGWRKQLFILIHRQDKSSIRVHDARGLCNIKQNYS